MRMTAWRRSTGGEAGRGFEARVAGWRGDEAARGGSRGQLGLQELGRGEAKGREEAMGIGHWYEGLLPFGGAGGIKRREREEMGARVR